jgi:hypothetical protein
MQKRILLSQDSLLSGPPVRIFDWRSEMRKYHYLLLRRFLELTKALLIVLWLALRIIVELVKI